MALSVHSVIIPIILINPAGTCKFKAICYASFIPDADRGDGPNARNKLKRFLYETVIVLITSLYKGHFYIWVGLK